MKIKENDSFFIFTVILFPSLGYLPDAERRHGGCVLVWKQQ